MIYDVQFFIDKFSSIPEDRWCTGVFHEEDSSCANGHCGGTDTSGSNPELEALRKIFKLLPVHNIRTKSPVLFDASYYSVKAACINDGIADQYQQPTPKQRILAALQDIKKLQQPETQTRQRIVYVAVPETIKEQASELIMQ